MSLTARILTGLGLGVACGLFFGEMCAFLGIAGDVFVGLLQMTVLPYIVVSLILNVGRLSIADGARIARVAIVVLLILWAIGLVVVAVMPLAFPDWPAATFFSSRLVERPETVDLVKLYVPSNPFGALAFSLVPGVVLFCIALGVALIGLERKTLFLDLLDTVAQALTRVNKFVVRQSPYGVFAIAAGAAGTMSIEDLGRIQVYLIVYTVASLFLALWAIPLMIAAVTPFRYRDIVGSCREALVTAFATGKVFVVLPMLMERSTELFRRHAPDREDAQAVSDALVPLSYPFPHLGKILALAFVPFAAWFVGEPLVAADYPRFLAAGLMASFGGPLVAMPFLLDLLKLPSDLLQLMIATGVYTSRIGDVLGAMHLFAFTLVGTAAIVGVLRVDWKKLGPVILVTVALGAVAVVAMRGGVDALLEAPDPSKVVTRMTLQLPTVPAVVLDESDPNPVPMVPGQSRLDRIRERGVIRVGFEPSHLPWTFFNSSGDLVGYDVEMAHGLATDLGVSIEFVPFEVGALADRLREDHFDVAMSGLAGTVTRSEAMALTPPYEEVHLAVVVRDHRAREFATTESIRRIPDLRVGVAVDGYFLERLRGYVPRAEIVTLNSIAEFFEDRDEEIDALLTSAEGGSAWTILRPEYQVVNPDGVRMAMPLVYAHTGVEDGPLGRILADWVQYRRLDGTTDTLYDYWILGRRAGGDAPRFSVIRDVLHWVE